jgi:hypothetical protein
LYGKFVGLGTNVEIIAISSKMYSAITPADVREEREHRLQVSAGLYPPSQQA